MEAAPAAFTLSPLDRRRGNATKLNPYGVDGLVIDPDRQPIPGARIEIQPQSSDWAAVSTQKEETWSGRDGSFYLRRTNPGRLKLTVSAEGYAPRELEVVFSLPGLLQRVVVLTPANSEVEGRVVDAFSLLPVADAVVEVLYQANFEGGGYDESLQTETDQEGHFHFGPVPAGSIRLTAGRTGFFEDVRHLGLAQGEKKEAVLKLVPAETREFSLKDPNGMPVGGASVVRPDGWTIQSDETGHFRLPLIAELKFLRMKILARGYLLHTVNAPVAEVPETIVLTPGPILEGRIRDKWGRGIEGAEVAVLIKDGHQLRLDGQTLSDSDGRFSWALSEFAVDNLKVHKDGYVDHAFHFPSRQLPDGPVQIELRKGDAALELRILRGGLPVDRAYARIRQLEGPVRGTTWDHVVEGGAAESLLGDLSSGLYEVSATSPAREDGGFRIWRGSAKIDVPANRVATVTIHLSPGHLVGIGALFTSRRIRLDPHDLPSR